MKLRGHNVILRGERVVLRPMTEGDRDILLKWNSDPQVRCFCEEDDIMSWELEPMREMCCEVPQSVFCFIVGFEGQLIGEC